MATQSRDASVRANTLLVLREEYRKRIAAPRVGQGVARLIDERYRVPAISVPNAMRVLGVTAKPASNSIEHLIAAGILDPVPVKIGVTNYFLARELIRLTGSPLHER